MAKEEQPIKLFGWPLSIILLIYTIVTMAMTLVRFACFKAKKSKTDHLSSEGIKERL